MKEMIEEAVCEQLEDISKVDTKELGEAIDMIKDLSEAIYYCTITEAMGKGESKEEVTHHKHEDIRKAYIEHKMHGGDKHVQMQELEQYIQELSQDIIEMIEGASTEEKQML
jgi:Lhr-like helicase